METNRKFKLAAASFIVASVLLLGFAAGNYPDASKIEWLFWWWGSVSSAVLALYGATNVIQKGITRPPNGGQQ